MPRHVLVSFLSTPLLDRSIIQYRPLRESSHSFSLSTLAQQAQYSMVQVGSRWYGQVSPDRSSEVGGQR